MKIPRLARTYYVEMSVSYDDGDVHNIIVEQTSIKGVIGMSGFIRDATVAEYAKNNNIKWDRASVSRCSIQYLGSRLVWK